MCQTAGEQNIENSSRFSAGPCCLRKQRTRFFVLSVAYSLLVWTCSCIIQLTVILYTRVVYEPDGWMGDDKRAKGVPTRGVLIGRINNGRRPPPTSSSSSSLCVFLLTALVMYVVKSIERDSKEKGFGLISTLESVLTVYDILAPTTG